MTEPKIVTLDEYVCEHWGLTPKQMRGVDICGFNEGDQLLPLDMSLKSISYGDGSFGFWPEGYTPSRGPIKYFGTTPLDSYLTGIHPAWMRRRLAVNDGSAKKIGYAINIFVPKDHFRDDIFDDVCDGLKERLPATIKMDETTKTDNNDVFYGRAGSEGGDFRFRDLTSAVSSEPPDAGGKIRQYIPTYGRQRHRLGWMYPNQIQICWNGSPESTVSLIRSVAGLVQERRYEAHFDLRIDRDGLMRTGFGITGVFYKPKNPSP